MSKAHNVKGYDSQRPSRTRMFCAFVNASGEVLLSYATARGIDIARLTITYENATPKYADESCQLIAALISSFEGNVANMQLIQFRLFKTNLLVSS